MWAEYEIDAELRMKHLQCLFLFGIFSQELGSSEDKWRLWLPGSKEAPAALQTLLKEIVLTNRGGNTT